MPQLFPLVGISLKTENLTYLGPNRSFSGDLIYEIQRRTKIALSAFGRLSKRMFDNQDLMIHTKIAVYIAVVISTISYGCKTWDPYRRHIRLQESIHIRRLQLILGLCWWQKVTHSEIRSRAGIPSIKSMLLHCQLCWFGHIKDHIKSILKKCKIPLRRLETLASNRATWRSTSALGMSYIEDEYDRAAALRHSHRHQHALVLCPISDSVHQCPL